MTSSPTPTAGHSPMADLDWAHLGEQLATLTGIFALETGPEAIATAEAESAADPLGFVVGAADLAEVSTGWAAQLLDRHARARGLPPARHAASLAFQRYAHRVAGIGVATWLLADVVPDLRAERCRMLVRDGSPVRLLLPAPQVRAGTDAETLARTIVDDHLLPVAQALHRVGGAGMPNLWGNLGAAIAGACRHLSRQLPAELVRESGQALLDTRPRLASSGTFRVLSGPRGEQLFFDRHSCCHWYAVRDGRFCSWCSRLTQQERTDRFTAILEKTGDR